MKKIIAALLIFAMLCGFGTIEAAAAATQNAAETAVFSVQADAPTDVEASDSHSDIIKDYQKSIEESNKRMIDRFIRDRNKKYGLLEVIWSSILSFFGFIFLLIF